MTRCRVPAVQENPENFVEKTKSTLSVLMWPFPVFNTRVKIEKEKRKEGISGRGRREGRKGVIPF